MANYLLTNRTIRTNRTKQTAATPSRVTAVCSSTGYQQARHFARIGTVMVVLVEVTPLLTVTTNVSV